MKYQFIADSNKTSLKDEPTAAEELEFEQSLYSVYNLRFDEVRTVIEIGKVAEKLEALDHPAPAELATNLRNVIAHMCGEYEYSKALE